MSMSERLRDLIEPLVTALGLELFDLEFSGSNLVVTIERRPVADRPRAEQPTGVGIDDITAVTRAISRMLDEQDPIPSAFTLEVSSPGLERPLRVPAHFQWAVGQLVTIKTTPGFAAGRRLKGTLVRAGSGDVPVRTAGRPLGPRPITEQGSDDAIEVRLDGPAGETVTIRYDEIERARTVFEWGPPPKPTKPTPPPTGTSSASGKTKPAKTKPGKAKPGKATSSKTKAKSKTSVTPSGTNAEKQSQQKKVTTS